MRQIELLEDLKVRFPGRGEEFDLGLEIGAICIQMAQGELMIERTVSAACAEQLRPLAVRFDYTLIATSNGSDTDLILYHASRRPRLRVVSR